MLFSTNGLTIKISRKITANFSPSQLGLSGINGIEHHIISGKI